MILRAATSADLPHVERIVSEGYTPWIAQIGKPPAPMLDDYGALISQGAVTIAERDGKPAGVLVLLDRPDHLLLDNVVVDPAHQGHGIGGALLRHAEQEAGRRGLSDLRLYTNALMTSNIATYLRHGYVETGRAEQNGHFRVFFRKVLP